MLPAAFPGERHLPFHRTAPENGQRHALLQVVGVGVQRTEQVGAHRAGPLALGSVHPEIGDQRLLVAEQVAEADLRAVHILEAIILLDGRARRQLSPLLGDAVDMPLQFDLLRQQFLPGLRIGFAFSGAGSAFCRQFA